MSLDQELLAQIDKYKEIMQKNPNSREFLKLADLYRKLSVAEEAIKILKDGLKKHPDFVEARLSMARIFLCQGQIEDATREFEAVIQQDTGNFVAYKLLGEIAMQKEEHERAAEHFGAAYKIKPDDEECRVMLDYLGSLLGRDVTPKITILVADDGIASQRFFEIVLKKEGYHVIIVGSGAEALKQIREKQPDLAMIDAVMPEIDGYQICQALKQDPKFKNLPVMMLTGMYEDVDRVKAARIVGEHAIFDKPAKSQVIISRVKEFLKLQEQYREMEANECFDTGIRVDSENADTYPLLYTHLLTLPLTHSISPTPSRPAFWMRSIGALSISLPLCFAQDFGIIIAQPHEQLSLKRPDYFPEDMDTSEYLNFLTRLAKYPLVRDISTWDLSDTVVSVMLARLVSGIEFPQSYSVPGGTNAVTFIQELANKMNNVNLAQLWHKTDRVNRPDLKKLLSSQAMTRIEFNLRQFDGDELRFLHTYGYRFAGSPDPRDFFDLFTFLDHHLFSKKAQLALSQVLRLLPNVSQVVNRGGVQTYAMEGYEGLTQKGSLDSLIPTEFAYPEMVFWHRFLNQEALYYGREGQRERQRELAYIVTQSSLELLGDGEVLSKGLTLALAQTMQRRGCDVKQSFIGSECTPPNSINRLTDVYRILYYRKEESLRYQEMLETVLGQLRCLRELYRGMQVFWVVGEHWDADEWKSHDKLYRELRHLAGQQAWFIQISKRRRETNGNLPTTAKQFHHYHVIHSNLMWKEQNKEFLTVKERKSGSHQFRSNLASKNRAFQESNFVKKEYEFD